MQRILRPGRRRATRFASWGCRPRSPGRTSASWAATERSTDCAWPGHSRKPIRSARVAVRRRTVQPAPSIRLESRADRRQRAVCRRSGGRRLRASDPRGRNSADAAVGHCLSASTIVPATEDLMSWRIGDHGFRNGSLAAGSRRRFARTLRPWLDGWLASHGLEIEQVGQWAVHPGGPRILQACVEALELEPEAIAASRAVLAEFGNMSSPTILFIVERLRRQAAAGPVGALGLRTGPDDRSGPGRTALESGSKPTRRRPR